MKRFFIFIAWLLCSISLFAGTGFPKEVDDFIRDNSNTLLELIGKQDEQIAILSQKIKTAEERSRKVNYDYKNSRRYKFAVATLAKWNQIKEKEKKILMDLFVKAGTHSAANEMEKLENLIAQNLSENSPNNRNLDDFIKSLDNFIFVYDLDE